MYEYVVCNFNIFTEKNVYVTFMKKYSSKPLSISSENKLDPASYPRQKKHVQNVRKKFSALSKYLHFKLLDMIYDTHLSAADMYAKVL